MERARVDVWADTFAQLMAKKKPRDVWVLHPQERLVPGDLESGGFQYQLKGLSRLQCSRCLWTWGSAHVHILFHLWWDGNSSQGLVKMRVWGQQCRLCPLDTLSECQVSPADVRIFLGKLVLHILWKCYGDSSDPGLCPEIRLGDFCEACDLGLCFLQQMSGPVGGPMVETTSARKGRQVTAASGQQLLTPSSGCKPVTVPLLVVDFIKDMSESDDFLSGGEGTTTIPFSLADGHQKGSFAAAGGHGSPIIGQGSLCLSGSTGIPVNIGAPIFHNQGLPSGIQKAFALRGFLFKGQGFVLSPISFNNGQATPGSDPPLVSYIIGLMANGEGSVTFPSSLANTIKDKDVVSDTAQDRGKEGGSQSDATNGDSPAAKTLAEGPTAHEEGSVTFPFIVAGDEDSVANITEAEEKEGGPDPATAQKSSVAGPITMSQGSITIPFSVFRIVKCKGPSYMAKGPQSNGFVTYSYYQKRRLRPRPGKFSCGSYREEDFCSCRAHRRRAESSEDLWICISMAICVFWLMCMYRLNLGAV